jgi:hypothetical protein
MSSALDETVEHGLVSSVAMTGQSAPLPSAAAGIDDVDACGASSAPEQAVEVFSTTGSSENHDADASPANETVAIDVVEASSGSDDEYSRGSGDEYSQGSEDEYSQGSGNEYSQGSGDEYSQGSGDTDELLL